MTRIRLVGVSFAHDESRPLIEDATLELSPGWTALVGANGAGKSTLLDLIRGRLRPSRGSIELAPEDALVVQIEQDMGTTTEALCAFAEDFDRGAARLCARLGLDRQDLGAWPRLSAGERKRWHLAQMLHARPEVSLLDEPETFLDAASRVQLAEALLGFRGTGLIVSHDRQLIDQVAKRTLWLEDGRIEHFVGGYTAASEARALAARQREAERRLAKRELTRLGRELEERKTLAAAADRQKNASRRMKSRHDNDARSALARGRVEQAAATLSKRAGSLEARVTALEHRVAETRTQRSRGRSVHFEEVLHNRRLVLRVELPGAQFDDRVLFGPCTFALGRSDRVWIHGANGTGKSTLLRQIVHAVPAGDRLFHLPQEIDEPARRAAQAELRALRGPARARVMSLAAALGLDPEILLASSCPSPGEAKKLLLSMALAAQTSCLVLDEPETHLDAPSVDRLQAALSDFRGAILLVSHDERLAEKVTDRRLLLREGALVVE